MGIKRVVALTVAAVLLMFAFPAGDVPACLLMRVPSNKWDLCELTRNASLVVIGEVLPVFRYQGEGTFRLLRLEVHEALKGSFDEGQEVYVADAPANWCTDSPPELYTETPYLFFLEPAEAAFATMAREALLEKGIEAASLVRTMKAWQGAIPVAYPVTSFPCRGKVRLERGYGLQDPEEITQIARDACLYLELSDEADRRDLRADLEARGKIYREFFAACGSEK